MQQVQRSEPMQAMGLERCAAAWLAGCVVRVRLGRQWQRRQPCEDGRRQGRGAEEMNGWEILTIWRMPLLQQLQLLEGT